MRMQYYWKKVAVQNQETLTLFNAVLLAAIFHALNALLKVVLGRCALLGVSADCEENGLATDQATS